MSHLEREQHGKEPSGDTKRLSLNALATFESSRIPVDTEFGALLSDSALPIVSFVDPDHEETARTWQQLLGVSSDRFVIVKDTNPLETATEQKGNFIPLLITSAIDPTLKDMLFSHADFGELLADSFPVASGNTGTSPTLHCVGITRHGIRLLENEKGTIHEKQQQLREARTQQILGDIPSPQAFRTLLQSQVIREIHFHALGPEGTNIAQAAKRYIQRLGLEEKTEIIVHPAGVTPLDYATIAKEKMMQSSPGVLHLHMECAVYNNMGKLFHEHQPEFVFADTEHMALDVMQLASIKTIDALRKQAAIQKIRVTTHPSPAPLITPWIEEGSVEWIEASSNSAAALMVRRGQADACVTTASTVDLMRKDHMHTVHTFGSPNMIFTVGSTLSPKQLHTLQKEAR